MRLLNITFLFFILSGCTSFVDVDYDNSINFADLNTFRIISKPIRVSSDTRINSPFMQERVVNELNVALANKGFKKLTNNAELEVNYYLDIKQEVETEDSGVIAIGIGSSSHHSSVGFGFSIPLGEASSIDKLVLTIDIISAKTEKLIWRGSLGYSLYAGSTPESYTKLVKELVVEILENFPPR